MLNSKAARLIIALLAAVLIWGYVVGEVNPAKTKTIRSIPIAYTYEDALNERGLAISGAEDEYINLEVSGARAILGYISPSDISATINVASAQKGENEMSISIRVPSGITVNKQSTTRTTVTVENLVQKPVDVVISYSGDFQSGDQGSTVNMSSTQVIVSGAESLIESVEKARGIVDASNVGDSLSAISTQLEAIDAEGSIVSGVKLSQRMISVASIIARNKTVELSVPITDKTSDKYIRETVVPEQVTIFGNADLLNKIEKIDAKTVDISQVTESKEIDLQFEFPSGVTLAEGEDPKVAVEVFPIEEKVFDFTSDDISIIGANDEYSYTINSNTRISVKALDRKSVLDEIAKTAIKLSVDVSGITETGEAELKVECQGDILEITAVPNAVTVEVSNNTSESGTGNAASGGGN